MSIISPTTKTKAGAKAAKAAKAMATRPRILASGTRVAVPTVKFAAKARKPLVKRRARRRADRLGKAARKFGEVVVEYGPTAAYELGLAEPPKEKRTAPRVVAGIVIGATAVYFLEPEQGPERRKKVAELVA